MTTITRAQLIAKGLIKPSTTSTKAFTVKANPQAVKSRYNERYAKKTERAVAILKAAVHRERSAAQE